MGRRRYRPFRIIRDTREKKGSGWFFRASANCDGMEIKKLETGDYTVEGYEDMIMLERKTITDLWGPLTKSRDRFLREMERAKLIPARYIVIEGSLADAFRGCEYSKVSANFILSSLILLEQHYGVHVIFASKRKDITQRYVRKLLEKLFQHCEDGVIQRYTDGRPDNLKQEEITN